MRTVAWLADACMVLAYFLMADYWAPALVKGGKRWAWWLVLLGIVGLSYAISFSLPRRRGLQKHTGTLTVTVAYLLLLLTLFSYDQSVRPYLQAHGIGFIWIVALGMTVVWVAGSTLISMKGTGSQRGSVR